LLLLLVGLRWWWGWDAHRRLQAEIDQIVAAGEPIYPEDFDPPEPVPDDENAAKLLLDAEVALNLTQDDESLITAVLDDRLFLEERVDEIRPIVEKNAPAFNLVHQARSRTRADWGLRFRTPVISAMLPALEGQRRLTKLLSMTAGYQHATGDDAAAIETLRDALAQAGAVDSGPTVISHLVAMAMGALGVNRLEELAPSLAVRAESETIIQGGGAASRGQIETLIAELLAEDGTRRAFVRAMQAERMAQLDTVNAILDGRMTLGAGAAVNIVGGVTEVLGLMPVPLTRPLFEFDAIFTLDWGRRWVAAAGSPHWPAAAAVAPVEQGQLTEWDRMLRPISSMLLPWLERAYVLHFRALAMRRMAAIALAIRLYEIDHGRRPLELGDLVPGYLPEIPADPFADDGRPVGYLPDSKPPVLYSIGKDGLDDGGAYTFYGSGGEIHREKLDSPFFLNGHRPRRPEPGEDWPAGAP
jgi:hypothetical protein